jgi:hypothetical protein
MAAPQAGHLMVADAFSGSTSFSLPQVEHTNLVCTLVSGSVSTSQQPQSQSELWPSKGISVTSHFLTKE